MSKQHYPAGWDAARVQRLIDHYENMTDEEMIAEDEAARKAGKNHLPVPAGVHEVNGMVIVKERRRQKKTKRPTAPQGSKRRNASGPNEKSRPVAWRSGSKVLPIVELELKPIQKIGKQPRAQPRAKGRKGKHSST